MKSSSIKLFSLGQALLLLLSASWLPAATTLVVRSAVDGGPGTLRQALLDANTSAPPVSISFALPGPVPVTINVLSALPAITQPVSIDGTTQPGYAGQPVVELNGAAISAKTDGLSLKGGHSTVRGLAINRFTGDGIRIETLGGNHIEGNFLGTDPGGTLARGNGDGGVAIINTSGNVIGGAAAGAGNLASGGNLYGIYLVGSSATSNVIQGNRLGTDVTGLVALSNRNHGLVLSDAAFNVVGGTVAGAGNLISGNGLGGISILGGSARSNRVEGNLIGTDITGRAALSNRTEGILLYGVSCNTVGGEEAGAGNVISGNGGRGVLIQTSAAFTNVVAGNFIGTDRTGAAALGNAAHGVEVLDSAGNRIGGSGSGARNIISGNQQSGVSLSGSNSWGNLVQGNHLGSDRAGSAALANKLQGVIISGGISNVIGGSGAGNVISGNSQSGVLIVDLPATGNQVEGNLIGLAAGGSSRLANGYNGVRVETGGNRIGGSSAAARNVISANGQSGVYLNGLNAAGNRVEGNYLGTDRTGTVALGNGYAGVGMNGSPFNVVGGTLSGAGNLIAANGTIGVYLNGTTAVSNQVAGNTIGTDAAGVASLGNVQDGVSLFGSQHNLVGGPEAGAGNLISANEAGGVFLSGGGTISNVIQGNWIGLQRDGVSARGNAWHGIELDSGASRTTVGGTEPGAGNRIAFARGAGYDGVRIPNGSTNVLVRGNSLFSNGGTAANGLGIDLGADGVTANDAGDADEGGNRLQNFPVVTNATGFATTVVQGSLKSRASRTYTVDLYVSPAADASGYGEGKEWLGAFTVTTDGSGTALFENTWPSLLPRTGVVTATATDADNNTSEFSAARAITPVVSATPATYVRGRGLPLTILVIDVAKDEANGPLTVQVGVGGQGATITTDNLFIYYTPANEQPDSFAYTVRNSFGASATGTITIAVTNPGGRIQSITRAGELAIRFAGISGGRYEVQRSANLTNWTMVTTATMPASGLFYFSETPPTNPSFYRWMLR